MSESIYEHTEHISGFQLLSSHRPIEMMADAFKRAITTIFREYPDVDFTKMHGCAVLHNTLPTGRAVQCIFAPHRIADAGNLFPGVEIDEIPADVVRGLMFKTNPRWLLEHLLLETP